MAGLSILHGCRTIQLTKGFNALIDEADFEVSGHLKWCAIADPGRPIYAARNIFLGMIEGEKRFKGQRLHRVLMGNPEGMLVDHHNGDGRDNRRTNLRVCTKVENCRNRRKVRGVSRFKGVSPHGRGKWQANIADGSKQIYLGYFGTEIEAARAYDAAAIRLHGEFACTNAQIHLEPLP